MPYLVVAVVDIDEQTLVQLRVFLWVLANHDHPNNTIIEIDHAKDKEKRSTLGPGKPLGPTRPGWPADPSRPGKPIEPLKKGYRKHVRDIKLKLRRE